MRKIGEFLLARNRNAIIVAFIFALLPVFTLPGGGHLPVGFLAAIVIGLVTLHKGWRDGLMILPWVALPAIALLYLHKTGFYDLTLFRYILIWLLASLLASYQSWRMVLEIATLVGLVAVIGAHIFVPDLHVWWSNHLTKIMGELNKSANLKMATGDIGKLVKALVPIATGSLVFVTLLGTTIMLLLSRWWQLALSQTHMLRSEFANIHMGWVAAVVAILVMVAAGLKLAVAIDCLPVLTLPFMFAALSLVHFYANQQKTLLIPLLIMYVALFFFFRYMVILLALVGLIDSLVNFRQRWKTVTK